MEITGAGSLHAGNCTVGVEPRTVFAGRNRTGFVLLHLVGAITHARRLRALEAEHDGEPFGAFWTDIAIEALGGVTSVFAALECYINELLADREDHLAAKPDYSELVARRALEQGTLMEKYELVYRLRSGRELQKGQRPAQDIQSLKRLRDAVVHFRAEWLDERDVHRNVAEALKQRFPPSKYFPDEPLFPRSWASEACILWAIRSAVAFMDEFMHATELPDKLAPIRTRLP